MSARSWYVSSARTVTRGSLADGTGWDTGWDWDGGRSFAEYDVFRVDSHEDSYRLHVRGYHGNAGALQRWLMTC